MFRLSPTRLTIQKLPTAAVVSAVAAAPISGTWKFTEEGDNSSLTREYKFKDFHQAWAFMSTCVPFINEADHHPEWFNVYNKVQVKLTTHDCGNCVSERDLSVAAEMERVAKAISSK